MLTGDTLFVEGVGRPDLADQAEAFAHNLYRSLHERVLTLPDATRSCCPATTAKACPSTRTYPSARPWPSCAAALEPLQLDEDDFVSWATARAVPRPPNYVEIIKANMGRADLPSSTAPDPRARPQPLLRVVTHSRDRTLRKDPAVATITHADDPTTFDTEVLQSAVPVVVDFWAAWCGPCRMVSPELEKLADAHEGALKVVKVDVDANRTIAGRYGIQGIPTIALFPDGQAVARSVGAKPRAAIEVDLGLTHA